MSDGRTTHFAIFGVVRVVGWDKVASTAGPPAIGRKLLDALRAWMRIFSRIGLVGRRRSGLSHPTANRFGGPTPKRLVPPYSAKCAVRLVLN